MGLEVVAQLIDDNRLVPAGGTTNQVLKKQSGNDGDTYWDDESGGESGNIDGGTPSSVYTNDQDIEGGTP